MRNLIPFFLLAIVITATSCEYDSSNDLVEVSNVETITYSNTIKNIIDNNCITCHKSPPINSAPMPLLTFENVREAVQNRNLTDRISASGGSIMPPIGNALPQNTIDLVIKWKDQGFQE